MILSLEYHQTWHLFAKIRQQPEQFHFDNQTVAPYRNASYMLQLLANPNPCSCLMLQPVSDAYNSWTGLRNHSVS